MFVIWFTGLPCSGKTTIANELVKRIPNMIVLDGDNLRSWLSQEDFSKEGRVQSNKRVATVAKMLADHDVPVCVSLVSPDEQNRKDARDIIGNERFLEVYVRCPLEICEGRDVKGMYKKARQGKICNFTGIDDPYEEPRNPDLIVDTDKNSLEECVENVLLSISKWSKPFVMITGLQRSGTSFLARALNLCGVYLGSREIMNSTEVNPYSINLRGAWENKEFFNAVGSKIFPKKDRRNYSDLPEDIFEAPALPDNAVADLKSVLHRLINHHCLASGMKIAIPLVVKALLPYLPENTIVVATFRHPLRVADSILRGRGVPLRLWDQFRPRFLDLWRAHNKALLEILDERPSFLLNFDWSKDRMLNEIHTIVRKLGLVETDLTSWYTDELKHSDNYVDTNNSPNNDIKEIYEYLLLRAEQNYKVVISSYYQPKVELKGVIMDLEAEVTSLSEVLYKLSRRLDEPRLGILDHVKSVIKKITR